LLTALRLGVTGQIFVANLPDLTKLPYFIHGTVPLNLVASQTSAWNTTIAAIVARHNAVLVDLFHSDLADHPEYIFLDGFHPSTIGYQHLADTFWGVIEAHGGPTA
jgi:lysophospholipase L1-like esterase